MSFIYRFENANNRYDVKKLLKCQVCKLLGADILKKLEDDARYHFPTPGTCYKLVTYEGTEGYVLCWMDVSKREYCEE